MEQDLAKIEISKDLHARLMSLAELDGTSPSDLAQNIIAHHISSQEDFAESERRWQKYKKTGEHLTQEEFLQTLDELIAKSDS